MTFAYGKSLVCLFKHYMLVEINQGNIEKAASGVLAILPCSRTGVTFHASNRLRSCLDESFYHFLGCWRLSSLGGVQAMQVIIFNSFIR